jgi:hypothetical protein
MLFRILHILSILTRPNIFLNICLSKMCRLFSSFAVKVQVSDQYVTTGLIIVLYIFVLVFFLYFLMDFVVFPPGHGSNVTDFWGWDAHEAQLTLSRWCGWWYRWVEGGVPGGPLNLNSTNLLRPWSPRESSPSEKTPTVEPGIGPGTSWLVVRNSDH